VCGLFLNLRVSCGVSFSRLTDSVYLALGYLFPLELSVDVCGSCGVIEESSPLWGRFVSPLIRDLESRRYVLTGQSTGWAIVNRLRVAV
jgi:hypothetical protein